MPSVRSSLCLAVLVVAIMIGAQRAIALDVLRIGGFVQATPEAKRAAPLPAPMSSVW